MADAPFGWSDPMAAMPETIGADRPVREALSRLGLDTLKSLWSTVTGPGNLMQPNPYPAGSEEASWYDDQRQRGAVDWARGAAMNLAGSAPLVSNVAKPGEVAFGIVPTDAARAFGIPAKMPEGDLFRRAVENTPGARIEEGSLTLPVTRNQRPEQELEASVRGGVFYLPQGSKDAKFYSGTNHNFVYGGTQPITGETAFKAPLFVKGATGGKAPEAAFDQLLGKGAYQNMRTDALRSAGGYGLKAPEKEELARQFLEKYAPELADQAWHIVANSQKGNQMAYALQEAAVASAARRAGHDGVIGYSTRRNPTKDPFITEVFDTRESHYPGTSGQFEIWPASMFGGGEVGALTGAAAPLGAGLEAKYPGLKLDVSTPAKPGDYGVVGRIVVPEAQRGKGIGTQAMRDLIAEADARGVPLALSPSADFGGSVSRLRDFYDRLGFVKNAGRNKDFATRETMIRPVRR